MAVSSDRLLVRYQRLLEAIQEKVFVILVPLGPPSGTPRRRLRRFRTGLIAKALLGGHELWQIELVEVLRAGVDGTPRDGISVTVTDAFLPEPVAEAWRQLGAEYGVSLEFVDS